MSHKITGRHIKWVSFKYHSCHFAALRKQFSSCAKCGKMHTKQINEKFHWSFWSVSKQRPVDKVHLFISASTFQKCHRMNHMFCRSIKQHWCVCVWPINGIPIWTWHFFCISSISIGNVIWPYKTPILNACSFVCVFLWSNYQTYWSMKCGSLVLRTWLFIVSLYCIWNTHERTVKKYNVIIWIPAQCESEAAKSVRFQSNIVMSSTSYSWSHWKHVE